LIQRQIHRFWSHPFSVTSGVENLAPSLGTLILAASRQPIHLRSASYDEMLRLGFQPLEMKQPENNGSQMALIGLH